MVLPVTSLGLMKSLQKSRAIWYSCYKEIFAFFRWNSWCRYLSCCHPSFLIEGLPYGKNIYKKTNETQNPNLLSSNSRINPSFNYANEPNEKVFGYYWLKSDLYTYYFWQSNKSIVKETAWSLEEFWSSVFKDDQRNLYKEISIKISFPWWYMLYDSC